MEYICKYCSKTYKTNQSRSNHYRIYHTNKSTILPQNSTILPQNSTILPQNSTILPQNSTILPQNNIYLCSSCNKKLSRLDSLKRHELKCKYNTTKNDTILELKNKNLELTNKFDQLLKLFKIHPKTLQKINKQLINNTNNGSINNISNTNNGTINIVKFGSEDISSILSQSEVLKILNRKLCSLEESIKLIHFNEKRPQLKNIYITIFMYKAFALYINVNWE